MAVDRYTKFLLTVIAGCLLWLCVAGLPAVTYAQQNRPFQNGNGPAVPVIVVGTGTLARNGDITVSYRGNQTDPTLPVSLPYSAANPLPASLPYTHDAPLPAEVTSIRKGKVWEPVTVFVEDAVPKARPGLGRER
jgi:hypothetical protein